MKPRFASPIHLIAFATTFISVSGSVQAASQVWKGTPTDANWATAGNWVGGAAPGSTSVTNNADTATFSATLTNAFGIVTNPVIIDANRNLKNITFDTSAASAYVIGTTTGGNTLLLTSGGAISMTSTAIANNQTINAPLQIQGQDATYSFINNSTSSGTLTIGGAVSFSTALTNGHQAQLTLDGTNAGDNTFTGVVGIGASGSSARITKIGTGTWILGGAQTYTGPTTVNGGILKIGGSLGATPIVINSGGTLGFTTAGALTNNANSITLRSGGVLALDYSASTNKLADGAALRMNGGSITLAGGSHSEVVASTSLQAGASSISQTSGGSTLRLNAITRTAGATLNLGAASIADTDSGEGTSLGYATIAGANFATAASGVDKAITAVSSVTPLSTTAGTDTIDSLQTDGATLTGSVTTRSLKIAATSASQTLNLGGNSLSITSGGLLVTGANSYAITGGQLGAGNAELIIHHYAGGALTLDSTVSGGTGSLTKAGSGTLILNAANTFTGQTSLAQGVIQLGNARALQNSTLAVSSDGANGLTFSSGIGSFTIGGLSASGNSKSGTITLTDTASAAVTLLVGNNNASTTYDGTLGGLGGLTKIGTGTLTLRASNTYAGPTIINGGILQLKQDSGFPLVTGGAILPNTGLQLGGGALDVSSVTNTGNNQTFTGTTLNSGASSITHSTGNTSGASGTVNLAAITRNAGSTLSFVTNSSDRAKMVTSMSNSNGIIGGWATLGTAAANDWAVANGATTQVSALAAYQTSTDASTWVAADNVKIAANTTVNAATQAVNSLNFQTTTASGFTLTQNGGTTLTVTSGGILASETTAATSATHTITGGILTSANPAGNDLITIVNNAATSGTTILDIQSSIQDTTAGMGLTKSGGGTLLLSGSNGFTGSVYINAGILQLNNANALSSGTNVINFGNSTNVTGTFRLNGNSVSVGGLNTNANQVGTALVENASGTNASLTVNNPSSSNFAGILQDGTGSGKLSLIKSGLGTLTLSGANTYTDATTISAGTLTIDTTGVIGGGASGTAITVNGGTLTDNSTVATTGGIAGTSSLTITSGTANLNTANNYSGATSVTGTLSLADANAVQNSAVTLKNGATLQLRNNSATSFNSSGAVALSSVSAQTVTIDVGNNGSGTDNKLTLANGISYNAPSITAGTYTTTINTTGGNGYMLAIPTVTFNNSNSYGNGGNRNFILKFNPTSANVSLGDVTLTGSGTRVTVALNLDGTSVGNEITGAISMPTGRPLTKSGSGTWTLSGTNTYTGGTLITGGTLALGAGGSIDSTSEVSLGTVGTFDVSAKSGYTVGTLKGSGNVTGKLTVSTQLAIGNSPGTANFSSDLTLGSGSTYLFDLTGGVVPGAADLGDVAGALTINLGSILDLVQLGTYTANNKFTLFAYDGLLTGTFKDTSANVLTDGATFTDADGIWMIDYNDTSAGANGGVSASNTYVTITAIPEPRAALLGSLGLLALLRRRRA